MTGMAPSGQRDRPPNVFFERPRRERHRPGEMRSRARARAGPPGAANGNFLANGTALYTPARVERPQPQPVRTSSLRCPRAISAAWVYGPGGLAGPAAARGLSKLTRRRPAAEGSSTWFGPAVPGRRPHALIKTRISGPSPAILVVDIDPVAVYETVWAMATPRSVQCAWPQLGRGPQSPPPPPPAASASGPARSPGDHPPSTRRTFLRADLRSASSPTAGGDISMRPAWFPLGGERPRLVRRGRGLLQLDSRAGRRSAVSPRAVRESGSGPRWCRSNATGARRPGTADRRYVAPAVRPFR